MLAQRHHFIFIAGPHRSGTSLLHEILRHHPSISGFTNTGVPEDEGQHLQDVYRPAMDFGGPGRFGFDDEAYMDENHPLATQANAEKLFRQWQPYWNLECPNLIEKSPPNLIRTRFLQSLFPRSSFVILLRHPVAVAYATRKWSGTSIRSLLSHTLHCYERALADLPYLQRAYVLRYADLVDNPTRVINELLAWLALPPMTIQQEVRGSLNQDYFEQWHRDRKNPLRKLLSGLGKDINAFEQRSQKFGYSLKNQARILPIDWLGAYPPRHPPAAPGAANNGL